MVFFSFVSINYYLLISRIVCRRWKAVSERSWYLVDTLDLSPAGWGFPIANKIDEALFRKIILKCGKYISQISYTAEYPKLVIHFEKRLPNYISKYCPNVTNLDLSGILLFPRDVEIIAENCRKIKRLRLKLYLISSYHYELTKLFENNKDLEDIGIEKMSFLCRSLTKLPEHKMKTIMLECYIHFENELFSQVSIIKIFSLSYFPLLVCLIRIHHKCHTLIYSCTTDTRKTKKLEISLHKCHVGK